MQDSITKQRIAAKYQALLGLMDERMSRQWAAAEVAAHCWGGVRAVSEAIGMSPHTIRFGHWMIDCASMATFGAEGSARLTLLQTLPCEIGTRLSAPIMTTT